MVVPYRCAVYVDVLSISWSPDSTYLASCSIDNTVIVWNALKFPGEYIDQCSDMLYLFISFSLSLRSVSHFILLI